MTADLDDRTYLPDADSEDVPRRHWPIWAALCAVIAVLAGGALVVWNTSLLGYSQTTVTGADPDLALAVEAAVGVPTGTPLLRVDLDDVRDRIAALPQVESATVARRWPDELAVSVRQRVPAAVTMANGAWWLVDASGHVFERVGTPPGHLTTIEVARPGPQDGATMAALKVAGALSTGFRASVAAVSAPSPFSVSLRLADGKTVIWGSPQDNARKMQILPAVLRQPGRTYDISNPELVTVR